MNQITVYIDKTTPIHHTGGTMSYAYDSNEKLSIYQDGNIVADYPKGCYVRVLFIYA